NRSNAERRAAPWGGSDPAAGWAPRRAAIRSNRRPGFMQEGAIPGSGAAQPLLEVVHRRPAERVSGLTRVQVLCDDLVSSLVADVRFDGYPDGGDHALNEFQDGQGAPVGEVECPAVQRRIVRQPFGE